MKVVTDAAANLSPEKAHELGVDIVPFQVTFMGKTYRDGVDIQPGDLYRMYLENPNEFSSTSQPSVGDFVTSYKKSTDDEILSVHLSSGLSGACSSAEHAARMVDGKNVTVYDSKMVGPALGWMVEIAAHGALAGWSKERILKTMDYVKSNTITMVAFSDIKYLIHSGRINHLKGIMASLLKIKPIIGMNAEDGRYSTLGQEMTMGRAVNKMAALVNAKFGNQKIRMQLMHGANLAGIDLLKAAVENLLDTVEEKLVPVTLVLGAHAGPTVIGLAAIPEVVFQSVKI